jgi:Peptidase C65 Otubain
MSCLHLVELRSDHLDDSVLMISCPQVACMVPETASVLCRGIVQPNDPERKPRVDSVRPLHALMRQSMHDVRLHSKLAELHSAFPHYRPVIGDGNCFYRWCARNRSPQPPLHVVNNPCCRFAAGA